MLIMSIGITCLVFALLSGVGATLMYISMKKATSTMAKGEWEDAAMQYCRLLIIFTIPSVVFILMGFNHV